MAEHEVVLQASSRYNTGSTDGRHMDTLKLTNVSVVVAAEEHNPTILHPSCLKAERIVPDEWVVVGGLICTPPFSIVEYANGIAFRVESNRLQIIDGAPAGAGKASPAPEIAVKSVRALPHVRYTAVGINFMAFQELNDPDAYVIRRFLSAGSWNDADLAPDSAGVQLTYPLGESRFNLAIKPGRRQRSEAGPIVHGIVLEGNCHSDTADLPGVIEAIANYEEKMTQSWRICTRILGVSTE